MHVFPFGAACYGNDRRCTALSYVIHIGVERVSVLMCSAGGAGTQSVWELLEIVLIVATSDLREEGLVV